MLKREQATVEYVVLVALRHTLFVAHTVAKGALCVDIGTRGLAAALGFS